MRPMVRTLLLAIAAVICLAAPVAAQSGSVTGRSTNAATGDPLIGAQVEVRGPTQAIAGSAISDATGRWVVTGLTPGRYNVTVRMAGFRDFFAENVQVTSGAAATVASAMREQVYNLNPVIVTASKKPEKLTDAPATVAVVDVRAIEARPVVTPVEHLRSVPGIDIIAQGVQGTNVVARGFNNIFSTTLHTLTDYRIASIPSLRANLMHFVPSNNEDIERIEVVLGPGAALYGPNTANGVMHMITRSPLDAQGTSVTAGYGVYKPQKENALSDAGMRNVLQTQFRTSHLLREDFGIKLSGQFLTGEEWEFQDPDEEAARIRELGKLEPNLRIGNRDFDIQRYALEGRADWRVNDELTTVLTAGHTVAANGIELTGVGAGQTQDWKYSFVQARANMGRLFAQAYLNMSDAGETYLLRNGLQVTDNSKFIVTQLQHGMNWGPRQSFTYGADLLLTRPDTEGKIHGRNEDDDNTEEFGAYVQSETDLSEKFELVTAGRVDYHSRLDGMVFSPRAALVWKPAENQNFRATYNRAFSTPVSFSLYLDLPIGALSGNAGDVLGFRLRAMGTEPNGFRFINDDGTLVGIRSPFAATLGKETRDLLTGDATTAWALAIGALQSLGRIDARTAAMLRQIPVASNQIGLNAVNLQTRQVAPVSKESVRNYGRMQESITNTFEVGYKGILGQKFLLNAGVWYDKRTNLSSPLTPITPLLLLDSTGVHNTIYAALRAQGAPDEQARAQAGELANGLKGLPIATVSSTDVSSDGAEVIASYYNYGDLDLYGADIHATAILTDQLSSTVSLSLVSDDYFQVAGSFVGLNAPQQKAMAALNYRDDRITGEVRGRYTSEFPVYSAPYNATACIGEQQFEVQLLGKPTPCVQQVFLMDLNASYRLPWVRGTSVQLAMQNVLDKPHASFVGVPELGRFTMLRLRYEF